VKNHLKIKIDWRDTMKIEEFIKELKPLVTYDVTQDKHYMGSMVLTNQEIHGMLKLLIGDEYTKLNGTQRTKMRQRVFNEVRGDNNAES
jgi:transcriptional regulator CtsR